jgi:transposase
MLLGQVSDVSESGTDLDIWLRESFKRFPWGREPLEIDGFGPIIGHFSPERSRKMAKSKDVITQIRKATHRKFSADEKIRIVLEGLRGEQSISEICRRESIATSIYYKWSKVFLEAGKNGLTRDTLRDATSDEIKRLKDENSDLKKALAESMLDVIKYKKSLGM